jgi:pre-mRNA-processing factor 40
MLAENTEIDARTRWRDAVVILQDDQRFKNLEDVRDREELFKDFTLELEKKEKEDKRRTKESAMDQFHKVLDQFKEEKKINRKSVWVESKKLFADVICKTEYRSLDDTDFRRVFQDFTSSLEEE